MDPNYTKPQRGRPRHKKNTEQDLLNMKKMLSPSTLETKNEMDLNSLINSIDKKTDFEPFFADRPTDYRNMSPSIYSSLDYVFNASHAEAVPKKQIFYRETPEMIFNKKRIESIPPYNPHPIHYTPINNQDIYQHTILPIILSMNNEELYENPDQLDQFRYTGKLFLHKIGQTNFEQITVSNLKMLMREFGLNHAGKKLDLINRILDVRSQVLTKFKELNISFSK